jgi:hypothetical protein
MGGHAATTSRFTDKLLSNPHTALQWELWQHLRPADEEQHQRIPLGEQWGKSTELKAENSIAQCPLLNGREGKLLTNNKNKTIDIQTKVLPTEETGFAGLKPLMLDSTGGVVMGADTPNTQDQEQAQAESNPCHSGCNIPVDYLSGGV